MALSVNLKKAVWFSIILLLAVTLFGCAWSRPKQEKTARELADEAMEALRDKDYRKTIESFEKLKDWYPFSQYAILAELKLGDAHYFRKEYEEAVFAYEQFESLHPKNEAVPYVVYQIGRCHFDRLKSIDRDQTMARDAARTFERLIRNHPGSPFSEKAAEHIRICKKSLAEHDFYVGMFYYKSKHYKAALERFKTVLKSYPDLGVHYKAIQYVALCRDRIENSDSGGK
ncbi:MAG: outer membrane protein assembly factor BamD [Desulfobacterales bacterium]|nr:outer membrane protein assembly factor BamD [Desulfobacterales bacterium]